MSDTVIIGFDFLDETRRLTLHSPTIEGQRELDYDPCHQQPNTSKRDLRNQLKLIGICPTLRPHQLRIPSDRGRCLLNRGGLLPQAAADPVPAFEAKINIREMALSPASTRDLAASESQPWPDADVRSHLTAVQTSPREG